MILIRSIIEVVGFPEEYIADAIKKIVDNIKEKPYIKIKSYNIAETKKYEKMFSTFAELELEFQDLISVLNFCFDYLPSSVEIIQPENINQRSVDFAGFLNDLMLKLHEYNIVIRNLQAENKVLKMKQQPTSSSENKKNS